MCPGVKAPGAPPLGQPLRRTVLVVDDLPINRRIMRTMMHKLGFEVLEASNGLECLETMAAHDEVCAIFMDLKMPQMNGWEAAFNVRSLEAARKQCTGGRQPTLKFVPSGSYSTPVLTSGTSHHSTTESSEVSCATEGQLLEPDCDFEAGDSLPPATPPSSTGRVPIIACTATNLEERMCWCMSNRGVVSQATGAAATPSFPCPNCDDSPNLAWSAAEPVWMTSTVKDAALHAGMDQVLPKPIAMSALESSLDTWVPAWRSQTSKP